MSDAAVVEAPVVSKPDVSDLFMAMREDLRLVKTPRYPIHGPSGQKVGEAPGETVRFRDNVLRVPHAGSVTLEDGRQVDAGEIRDWLLSHRLHGNQHEGFWVVAQVAPAPTADELNQLMRAAMRLDDGLLERIMEEERAGWNRANVLEVAEESLREVREMKAEIEAQVAAKAAAEVEAQTAAKAKASK